MPMKRKGHPVYTIFKRMEEKKKPEGTRGHPTWLISPKVIWGNTYEDIEKRITSRILRGSYQPKIGTIENPRAAVTMKVDDIIAI